MKAYFTYGSNLPKETVELIETTLESLGLKLSTRVRIGDEGMNIEHANKIFKDNQRNLKTSDIVIAECSYHSNSIGYDISFALDEKKPLIVLYNMLEDMSHPRHIKNVPTSLKGNTSKYLILKEYDKNRIKKTLEIAIKDAKSLADTKFILIIPPEIDRYLEWNVKEKGVSKAEITRQAVERMMENDKAYLEYMKSYSDDSASN